MTTKNDYQTNLKELKGFKNRMEIIEYTEKENTDERKKVWVIENTKETERKNERTGGGNYQRKNNKVKREERGGEAEHP